jgi:NADH-quinone oxidoreductase subunit E
MNDTNAVISKRKNMEKPKEGQPINLEGPVKGDDVVLGLKLLTDFDYLNLNDSTTRHIRGYLTEACRFEGADRTETLDRLISELQSVDQILKKYDHNKESLIQILLDINQTYHWLPKISLWWVSFRLEIPLSQIYQTASFYKAFSLKPQGRHRIQVCLGTACQVREAPRFLDTVVDTLHVKPGETDKEMRFSLTTVNCLGCCALGPVMMVDEDYYSNPSQEKLKQILSNYK